MKKNILIKLSGASLEDQDEIVSMKKLDIFSKQIKILTKTYGIGIVLGGGNIWRGISSDQDAISRSQADSMGMLATVINGIALKASLEKNGLEAEIYSALYVPRITKNHDCSSFNKAIKAGKVIIFVGGTGMPYFSTDTCTVLRALEINSKMILMGKNGTNGLYDKDPNLYDDAKFISAITYDEVINKKLRVADLTSITMANDNNIEIYIFDIEAKNSLINVLDKKGKFTIIKK
ncbi:MAG: UMP kinase [Mycoplasmoidaceae bacterium]